MNKSKEKLIAEFKEELRRGAGGKFYKANPDGTLVVRAEGVEWFSNALDTHSQNREAEIRVELLLRVLQEIDGAETEYNPARHGTEPHDVFDLVKKYVGVMVFDIYGIYDALIPEQLEDKQ